MLQCCAAELGGDRQNAKVCCALPVLTGKLCALESNTWETELCRETVPVIHGEKLCQHMVEGIKTTRQELFPPSYVAVGYEF